MMKTTLSLASLSLALSGLVSACLYVPPVWDTSDAINSVDDIEVGVTTKEQVFGLLGQPADKSEDGNVFRFEGESSSGLVVLAGGLSAGGGLVGAKNWWIKIYFDEDGVVQYVTRSDDEPRLGSVEEQWSSAILESEGRERIDRFCRAAKHGHGGARFQLGRMLHVGDHWPDAALSPNPIHAYMWYTLALQAEVDPQANAATYRDELASSMTPSEISVGEQLAAEWTPARPCPS